MNQSEKGKVIDDVRGILNRSNIAVVAHYRGLTVGEMTSLRKEIRGSGSELRVVKNTLTKRATVGTGYEALAELLKGPTVLAFSKDPVAPAKVLTDFAKKYPKLELRGAVLNGKIVGVEGLVSLAKLPARGVLLAKLLGTMNAPISNFVGVLAAVPGSLVRVLEQIRQAKEGASA